MTCVQIRIQITKCSPSLLFAKLHQEQEEDDFLGKIVEAKNMRTYNTVSLQEHCANLQAVIYMHRFNCFDSDAEVWQTGLIPEKSAVLFKGVLYYVVRTYQHCAFGWPLIRTGDELAFDMGIRKYTSIVIFELDEVVVIPFAIKSPILLRAEGYGGNKCAFAVVGKEQTLLEHHTANGFRNIREPLLRQLLDDLGIVMPGEVDEDSKPKDDYRMMLLLSLDKSISQEDALARLVPEGDVDYDDMCADLLEIDEDLVKDGVDPKDLDKFQEEQAKLKDAKEGKKTKREGICERTRRITTQYAKIKLRVDPDWKPKKKPRAVGPAALTKKKTRIYKRLENDEDECLRELAPPNAGILYDPKNGRWRISYVGTTFNRSISWSCIGSRVAFGVALDQLWAWALEAEGLFPPVEVEAFLRELGLWTGPP